MIEADKYSFLFEDKNTLRTVAGVMIGIGCFITVVEFSGCYGAIKEVSLCLKMVGQNSH